MIVNNLCALEVQEARRGVNLLGEGLLRPQKIWSILIPTYVPNGVEVERVLIELPVLLLLDAHK